MNEQERAEEHLKTIRRLMEHATIYRAISAPTALVGGMLSIAACWFLLFFPVKEEGHTGHFALCWLVVLVLTAGSNTLFIVSGAKKRNEPAFSASMKTALTALAPPFMVAAVLTLVFSHMDLHFDFFYAVVWAICYGLGLLATSHFAPRSLVLLGWAFLLTGLLAVFLIGFPNSLTDSLFEQLKDGVNLLFMALTFGLYHLIYALCVWPRKGEET